MGREAFSEFRFGSRSKSLGTAVISTILNSSQSDSDKYLLAGNAALRNDMAFFTAWEGRGLVVRHASVLVLSRCLIGVLCYNATLLS